MLTDEKATPAPSPPPATRTSKVSVLVVGGLAAIVLVLVVGCMSPQISKSAAQKHEQGDYEEAIAVADRAIQIDPQDAKAYYNRGNTSLIAP